MSVWIRKRGRRWYVYRRAFDAATGRAVEKSDVYATRQEARRREAELDLQATHGKLTTSRMTLAEFVETEWRPHRLTQQKAWKTRDIEERLLKKYLLPEFGGIPLDEIGPRSVDTWLTRLAKDASAHIARRSHDVLRKVLRDALRRELIDSNPAAGAERPALPPRTLKLLSVSDFCQIVKATPLAYRPLVVTAATTGLRWGELAALRWDEVDVDLDAAKLHVRRQIPSNGHAITPPKTRAGLRTVDLWPVTVEALRRQREVFFNHHELDGYVFTTGQGGPGPLDHHNFTARVWRPLVKALGLPRTRFHDLRHLHASLLIAFNANPLEISQRLGHADASMVWRVYGHLIREGGRLDREAILAKIEEAFREKIILCRRSVILSA